MKSAFIAVVVVIIACSMSLGQAQPCCTSCVAPLKMYFSVDTPHGHCAEACTNPSEFKKFKFFEKNLTLATSSTPCADNGYAKYDKTESHGIPGLISITLDMYDPTN
eukprot:Nk52_evm53s236 gene=Nk52_evmTU53s236